VRGPDIDGAGDEVHELEEGDGTTGMEGGKVYWRVIGTRPDRTRTKQCSMDRHPPFRGSGGSGVIDDKPGLVPELSWENNCNTSSRCGLEQRTIQQEVHAELYVKDPVAGDGVSEGIDTNQWKSIRKLWGSDGITIYWYIESWMG